MPPADLTLSPPTLSPGTSLNDSTDRVKLDSSLTLALGAKKFATLPHVKVYGGYLGRGPALSVVIA
jgi:hypothetical protein